MKILVIGGSRFVGPYLINRLQKECEVTVFNRGQIQANYPKHVKFIQGDRNSKFTIKEHFDVVIDTVAYTGEQIKNAIDHLNFDFFVNFGTAASYKKPEIFPLQEDFPLGDWPVWGDYNKGKVDCENILKKSGVPYATLRPVFVFGPNNYADRENFIYTRIKQGKPLLLPGSGEAVIQFVFAKEVAESLFLLATQKIPGAFNCSGTEAITVNGLVSEMGKIVGKAPILTYNPKADGKNWVYEEFPFANENFFCSNEKLRKLGVKFTPLIHGLKEDYDTHYHHIS